jgi:hypothetical protein
LKLECHQTSGDKHAAISKSVLGRWPKKLGEPKTQWIVQGVKDIEDIEDVEDIEDIHGSAKEHKSCIIQG